MARGNRRENRAAAKAMLETPGVDKNAVKAEQAEQRDYLANTLRNDDNVDFDEDEESMNADDTEEREVEGEQKVANTPASPAPNVESGDAEADDDASAGDEGEGDDDEEEEVDEPAGKVEPSTEVGKQEPEKPADEKKPAEPAPTDEKKEKEEPAKPADPTTLSPEDAAKMYGEWRDQTEELLATHHYRLDEKQVEALNANPAEFIPRAMARVYMDSISAAFQQFTQYLPRMVDQVLVHREAYTSSEKKFFEKWPDLELHRDTVLRLGATYRAQNPKATMEQFIDEVGAQAMVALRKLPQAEPAPNGKDKKPNASNKPFTPATGSPGGTPTRPSTPANPFAAMADDFFSEMEEDIEDR